MPENSDTGAKIGVQSLSDVMAEVKAMVQKAVGETRNKMLQQGEKMARELSANGDLVVRKMEEQHQGAMEQFSDLLGNERAGDT